MAEAMTATDARDTVRRGAAFLDATSPGWAERIDPRRLDMGSCDECILGQLYGDYLDGLARIGFVRDVETPWGIVKNAHDLDRAVAHGFSTFGSGLDYETLAAAWREEIARRIDPESEVALG